MKSLDARRKWGPKGIQTPKAQATTTVTAANFLRRVNRMLLLQEWVWGDGKVSTMFNALLAYGSGSSNRCSSTFSLSRVAVLGLEGVGAKKLSVPAPFVTPACFPYEPTALGFVFLKP